jgi:hypothetical protein
VVARPKEEDTMSSFSQQQAEALKVARFNFEQFGPLYWSAFNVARISLINSAFKATGSI